MCVYAHVLTSSAAQACVPPNPAPDPHLCSAPVEWEKHASMVSPVVCGKQAQGKEAWVGCVGGGPKLPAPHDDVT
eukprot:1154881-Pelagomonas_calceolata.AAC.6